MTSAEPDLQDVMAAIGEVMLRWGFLEAVMMDKLDQASAVIHPTAPPIQQWRRASTHIGQPFVQWLEEIERAAVVRNLLAHGLNGARSVPRCEVYCRQPGGGITSISLGQLQAAAQEIDGLRLRLHLNRV